MTDGGRKVETKMNVSWPVLLTATIAPAPLPYLKMVDPEERWYQYQHALMFWLQRPKVQQIVFCDNSGYHADFSPFYHWAEKHHKTLEVLSYAGNDHALIKGRGFGEGELMRHALYTSQILTRAPGFFKVTGRLIVENFDQLEALTTHQPVVMSRRSLRRQGWADTRFFKMDRSFYCQYLIDVHEKAERDDWILGEAYAKVLAPFRIPSFPRSLRIHGIAGNGATYDDKMWRYMLKSLCAQAGLYRIRATS